MKKILFFLTFLCCAISGHAQWTQQSYFPGPILNLKAINNQVAWATVFSNTGVIRTTNGGITWDTTNTGFLFSNFAVSISLAALTADTAWYLAQGPTQNKLIYKTTNGGQTWAQQQITNINGYPYGIHFFNSHNGVMLSSKADGTWDFYTTANGGDTWVSVSPPIAPNGNTTGNSHTGAFCTQGNTIWLAGRSQYNMAILKSTDRGMTWNLTPLGITSTQTRVFPETIAFKDQNNGLLAMDSILLRTSDGGATWQPVNYSGPLCSTNIIHVPGSTSTYIAVGSSVISGSVTNGSAVSSDDGNTWTLLDTDSHMGVSFLSPTVGWTGGTNFVYKYNGSSPLGIGKDNRISGTSNLTIYPNPSKSTFQIEPATDKPFKLEVYDMVGNKILQQSRNGFGQNVIDLSAYKKGVYLLHIVNGEKRIVEKIVLH